MYFLEVEFQLTHERLKRPLSYLEGNYAHAAVFSAISKEDPVLGARLHNTQRNKHITIAVFGLDNSTSLLRLTFLGEEGLACADAFMKAVFRETTLRLGPVTCDVQLAGKGAGAASPMSTYTWADIVAVEPCAHMRIEFVTPTAITKQDLEGRRFTALFPEPWDVFGGLERRWRGLQGPVLPEDLDLSLKGGGCVLARYNLRSVEFNTSERTQIGFLGHAVYECRLVHKDTALALNSLARLSRFSGVGYQTARGMGAVQVSVY
jgi:hypothetical protein